MVAGARRFRAPPRYSAELNSLPSNHWSESPKVRKSENPKIRKSENPTSDLGTPTAGLRPRQSAFIKSVSQTIANSSELATSDAHAAATLSPIQVKATSDPHAAATIKQSSPSSLSVAASTRDATAAQQISRKHSTTRPRGQPQRLSLRLQLAASKPL